MLWFIVMLSRIPEGFNTNESQHSQAFPADLTKPKMQYCCKNSKRLRLQKTVILVR